MAAAFRGKSRIRQVTIAGSGLIGAGWVAAYLAHGLKVSVFDPAAGAEQKVRDHIDTCWPALMARGSAEQADKSALSFHADLAAALAGADFVQENTPERMELKAPLFEQLGALTPADVLIASSTSSLPITELQKNCRYPQRCVLGHPFNPVHLMPLVEVGGGEATDRAAVDAAVEFYASIGKKPIRLEREIFGHIANRLTSAMFREAVSLVANGIATVQDVDDAIRFGPALKWAIQGEFTTFHTSGGEGGLAAFLKHFGPGIIKRWESMSDPDLASPELQATLAAQMDQATGHAPVHEIAQRQDALLLSLLALLVST
jgi:3-hydroxyacyl-CoA dehydrogenase